MKMMKIAKKITVLFSTALFAFGLITTPAQAAVPTIITIGYTNATTTGFTANAFVSTNGGVLNSAYFQYSAVNSQTLSLNTAPTTVSPTGYFQHTFTGMTAGTYVFRAVVIVDGVIYNGPTKSAVVAAGASTTIPVLTTINGSLSGTTITMNGYFTSSSTPTQTFFQYNTTNNFASPQSTTAQSQTGLSGYFSGTLSNVIPGTTYYFRAVATNASGIGYGAVKSVVVPGVQVTLPSVTTTATTNITQTSATFSGTVSGTNITARGFQYYNGAWSSSPTSVTASGTTSFSTTVSGLNANTTYYVRATATNSAGTAYGSYVPFTTSGNTQPTCTDPSASNFGGPLPCIPVVTQFCTDPAATNYNVSFPCIYTNALPNVTTGAVNGITQNNATVSGSVTGTNITARGFQYYSGFWSSSPITVSANGTTTFTTVLSGLNANTTYYVRATATNSAGTAYGSYVPFTTSSTGTQTCTEPSSSNFGGPLPCIPVLPQLCNDPTATNYGSVGICLYPQSLSATTLSATNVMDTAAQIRGSYTGGVAASMRFKYGTNPTPTIGVTAYGNSISYTTYLTNLIPNTTYFYQACVTNNANVEFCGQTLSFTTTGTIIPQGQAPVAITQNAQVNGTSTVLSGFVDMQNTSGTYRFEYGTSPSFGMSTQTMQATGATTVSANAQNLIPNTMYYYRIVAQNNYGVTNGNTLTFTSTGGPVCGTNQTFGSTSNGLIWNAFGSGTINQTSQIPCNPNPCPPNACGPTPPPPQPTQGSVITTVATNVAQSTAQLNAIARNVNGTVAFEYGFSASQLGYTTQPQTINNAGGISFYDTVYNLEPNTTYYFRAFTQTNGMIIRGDIISFRTKSIKDPKVVVVNNGTGTGTATTAVMVKIENTYKNACVNDVIDYTITYKNTTTKTLKDVALVVTLPGELEFARATKGSYSKRDNTLTITIDSLGSKETDTINVQARAREVRQGMVTTATMSYTLPSGTQEQAIAYDIIDKGTCADNGNGLGAAALFGFDFFPSTLVGWLLLTAVILGLILFTRKYFVKE